MKIEHMISNDLLIVAYHMKFNGWEGANKSNFQRVLYFSAALSPAFLTDNWAYSFSNTIFGPHNNSITEQLKKLSLKQFLELKDRNIYNNRVEERYIISQKGIDSLENTVFKMVNWKKRVSWLSIIVKVLSIYGENFVAKLVKEDPNVFYSNQDNKRAKITTDDSEENLSKEFLLFVKEQGKMKINLEFQKDEDYLLYFFDVLYQKYKGGKN